MLIVKGKKVNHFRVLGIFYILLCNVCNVNLFRIYSTFMGFFLHRYLQRHILWKREGKTCACGMFWFVFWSFWGIKPIAICNDKQILYYWVMSFTQEILCYRTWHVSSFSFFFYLLAIPCSSFKQYMYWVLTFLMSLSHNVRHLPNKHDKSFYISCLLCSPCLLGNPWKVQHLFFFFLWSQTQIFKESK